MSLATIFVFNRCSYYVIPNISGGSILPPGASGEFSSPVPSDIDFYACPNPYTPLSSCAKIGTLQVTAPTTYNVTVPGTFQCPTSTTPPSFNISVEVMNTCQVPLTVKYVSNGYPPGGEFTLASGTSSIVAVAPNSNVTFEYNGQIVSSVTATTDGQQIQPATCPTPPPTLATMTINNTCNYYVTVSYVQGNVGGTSTIAPNSSATISATPNTTVTITDPNGNLVTTFKAQSGTYNTCMTLTPTPKASTTPTPKASTPPSSFPVVPLALGALALIGIGIYIYKRGI